MAAAATPSPRLSRAYSFGFRTGELTNILPHSTHAALDRGVINPHAGHILCEAYPAIAGFSRRIL
jgi:hypothetical protein